MFLTWIRWSSLVGPRGKDPGPRGRDPGPIGGAPNPWGVPNVSIPLEIFTGSPLDRIVEQWCTECWDAFNQGFLFPFPVRRLFFSKFNCQSDLRLFARLCRLGRLKERNLLMYIPICWHFVVGWATTFQMLFPISMCCRPSLSSLNSVRFSIEV